MWLPEPQLLIIHFENTATSLKCCTPLKLKKVGFFLKKPLQHISNGYIVDTYAKNGWTPLIKHCGLQRYKILLPISYDYPLHLLTYCLNIFNIQYPYIALE